jgi:branched-chain amino acid transport system permease protein
MAITLKQNTGRWRAYVIIAWAIGLGILVYIPFAYKVGFAPGSIDKGFRITQINSVICIAVAILGLNLVIGYSGQLSLGHSAFVGTGAYTTMILVADHGWPYLATLPVSAALCFAIGLIIGVPALRIRGLYLAIVTLSVAYVFPTLVLKYDWLTGGPNGKKPDRGQGELNPPSWMPFDDANRQLKSPLWKYCILIVMAAILFLLARNFVRSRPGRALIAVRDNQTGAAVNGVNLPLYKTMAFGVSGVYGGLAGSMLVMNDPFVSDVQFGLQLAIFLVVGLVVGGAGTISGAIPGALIYVFVPYFMGLWTNDQSGMPPGIKQVTSPLFDWLEGRPGARAISNVFFGIGLLIFVFLLPGGFIDGMRRLKARFVRIIPNPRWLKDRPVAERGAPLAPAPEHAVAAPTGD